jgi:alpha-glucosidase
MVHDPPAVNQPEIADIVGRDPERTPMQWDASANAGFAGPGVTTWLPVAVDYRTRNVAAQAAGPKSMLSLYRALAALRRAEPALHRGAYRSVDVDADDVFAYVRSVAGCDSFLVVLNFGDQPRMVDVSGAAGGRAAIALATGMDRAGEVNPARLALAANEGLLLRLG